MGIRTTAGASLALATGLATASLGLAAPSSATVHEITGMLCAVANGQASPDIFGPPGISGQNGRSGRGQQNLAKPLFATGVATLDPTGGPGGEALIVFDDTNPAAKITLTGEVVPLAPGLWVTDFTIDAGGWTHCLPEAPPAP